MARERENKITPVEALLGDLEQREDAPKPSTKPIRPQPIKVKDGGWTGK